MRLLLQHLQLTSGEQRFKFLVDHVVCWYLDATLIRQPTTKVVLHPWIFYWTSPFPSIIRLSTAISSKFPIISGAFFPLFRKKSSRCHSFVLNLLWSLNFSFEVLHEELQCSTCATSGAPSLFSWCVQNEASNCLAENSLLWCAIERWYPVFPSSLSKNFSCNMFFLFPLAFDKRPFFL